MKKFIAGILFLVILSLPMIAFAKPAPKRIIFKKGATKAVVIGRLNGYKDEVNYVIRLRKNQTLKISSDNYVTLTVLNPAGEDVMDRAANCNSIADISPTVAGDYRIEVVECAKADAWRGNFKLKIDVK